MGNYEASNQNSVNYAPEIESNLEKEIEIEIAQVVATRPQKQTKTKTEQQQSSLKLFKNISLLTVGKNSALIGLCFLVLVVSIVGSTILAYGCYRFRKSNHGSFKVGVLHNV